MPNPSKIKGMPRIPVQLTQAEFEEFILDQLPKKISGPKYKLSRYKMFNYVLKFIYMGCQWKMLPIDKDKTSRPEIHYTQIFRTYQSWLQCGPSSIYLKILFLCYTKLDALMSPQSMGMGRQRWLKKGEIALGSAATST